MWPFKKRQLASRIDGYAPPQPSTSDPWMDPRLVAEMKAHVAETSLHTDAAAFDGFRNCLTGIGDWTRDKTLGGSQQGLDFVLVQLPAVAVENRWRGSALGARIVQIIPDEMTREGYEVVVQPSEDDDDGDKQDAADRALGRLRAIDGRVISRRSHAHKRVDAFPMQASATMPGAPAGGAGAMGMMQDPRERPLALPDVDDEGAEISEAMSIKLEELNFDAVLWEALCYERAYGGAVILMGVDDGFDNLTAPLDEDRLSDVTHLNAFTGGWEGECVAWSYYQDPVKPNYGMPETYMIRNIGVPFARIPAPGEPPSRDVLPSGPYAGIITWVHESRLLVLPGIAVSRRARVQMRGWGDSIFTRVDEVLQQEGQTWGGVANLMTDFSQGVLAIDDLASAIGKGSGATAGGGGTSNLMKRAMALNLTRSISRIMLIDSKEKFSRDTVALTGIPEVIQKMWERVAAAAGMPAELLMAMLTGGLSKGDTTYRFFMDRIASDQKKHVVPVVKKLVRILFRCADGPTEGDEPERWHVEPRPLYQLTALEEVDLRLKVAQADDLNIKNQIYSPEEAAGSHYGGSKFDPNVTLNLKLRAEMADQYEKDRAERAKMLMAAAKQALLPPAAPTTSATEKPPDPSPKAGETPDATAGEKTKDTPAD